VGAHEHGDELVKRAAIIGFIASLALNAMAATLIFVRTNDVLSLDPGASPVSAQMGDSVRYTVFARQGGEAVDLSDLTVRWIVTDPRDGYTNASFSAVILDATNGRAQAVGTLNLQEGEYLATMQVFQPTNEPLFAIALDGLTVTARTAAAASCPDVNVSMVVTQINMGGGGGVVSNVTTGTDSSWDQATGSLQIDTNDAAVATNVYSVFWPEASNDMTSRQLWRIGTNDPYWATTITYPDIGLVGWSNIVFSFVGTQQTWVADADYALIGKAWGAGSGGGANYYGDAGGFVPFYGIIPSGTVVEAWVGQGGICLATNLNPELYRAWPAGGLCSTNIPRSTGAGCGGGSTRLYFGTNLVAVAGAAGGSMGAYSADGGAGYVANTYFGEAGLARPGTTPGTGGTLLAGGLYGGGYLQGGDAVATNCAGGGDGYYGGGAGQGVTVSGGCNAGGGSSYLNPSLVGLLGPIGTSGITDSDYQSGIGVAGSGVVGSRGGSGLLILKVKRLQ
jgi:hypothetical protein